MNHTNYMQRCVKLATQGLGFTQPNPMVGALLVHDNIIIGEGYHKQFGGNHAEVEAIKNVAESNRYLIPLSTLYVTLEPCSHFGKTPPCANFIIQQGIKKVVIGTTDPNILVSGRGIALLKQHNIEVLVGILASECKETNKHFFYFHQNQKPFITLKYAFSADGFMAHKNFARAHFNSALTNVLVHTWRSQHQAILVGTNTVLHDNPMLNVRGVTGNNPIKMIIDKDLKTPLTHNVFVSNNNQPTVVFTNNKTENTQNITYITIIKNNVLETIKEYCIKNNIQSILVEGGSKTLQSFIDANFWQEAITIQDTSILTVGINKPALTNEQILNIKTNNNNIIHFYKNKNQSICGI